jgi:peptide/nickel transport system substrate-binding protein
MDMPEPQRVVFLESGGEESRAQLMATNQMDAAQNLSVGTFEAIQAQNPNVIAWYADYPYAVADPCARQLEINTTVAPWDNANMRRAVAHIIDRTQIVNIAAEGAPRRRAPCSAIRLHGALHRRGGRGGLRPVARRMWRPARR